MREDIRLPDAWVLVVDDAPTNLAVARGLLKRYEIHIDCVASGTEAIDAVRSGAVQYDAIFMDYMMPGMDGAEALRHIREIGSEYARNVPVIAFSASATAAEKDFFLQKGFQGFISKPIEPVWLDDVVREWVGGKKAGIIKQKTDKPDGSLLDKLREACSAYDMPAVDKIIEQLNGFVYESGGELVGWLTRNAHLINYADIIRRISREDGYIRK